MFLADRSLLERVGRLDAHPTGPLWGRDGFETRTKALEVERDALEPERRWRAELERFGLASGRRALRARVSDLEWRWGGDGVLDLSFSLQRGSYATSVIRECVAFRDASRDRPR